MTDPTPQDPDRTEPETEPETGAETGAETESGLPDAAQIPKVPADPAPEAPRPPSQRLAADRRMLETLVCPATQSQLVYDREAQELISRQAHLAYPIRDGIPILLVTEARQLED